MSTIPTRPRIESVPPPTSIKPQLAKLVERAPDGLDWLHEMKLDGFIESPSARLLVGGWWNAAIKTVWALP
jgi:hypothetical protein